MHLWIASLLRSTTGQVVLKSFLQIKTWGSHRLPSTYERQVFDSENVTREGVCDEMGLHGIRGTVITSLFEAGNSESSVALRSGHRDKRSFEAYHNLHRRVGEEQKSVITDPSCDSSVDQARETVEYMEMEIHALIRMRFG